MPLGLQTFGHRANRLLAALEPEDFACLEPYLEIVNLPSGEVVYETGETLRYAYFPHDAIVALVTMMENGDTVEIAVFGREALFGLVTAVSVIGFRALHCPTGGYRIANSDRADARGGGRAPERSATSSPVCRGFAHSDLSDTCVQCCSQCRSTLLSLDSQYARPDGPGHVASDP